MEFRKYNWVKDTPDRSIAMIIDGVSGSGKTFLVNNIIPQLNKKKKYKKIILISSTSHLSGDFNKTVKKKNQYKAEKIDNVLNNLVEIQINKMKEKKKDNILVILDDVIGTTGKNIRYSQTLQKAFTSFRHLNIGIILILQDISGKTAPTLRLNATHIIMFKTNNYKKKLYLVENFLSVDNNKKIGYNLLSQIWNEPYKSIVVNQWAIQKANNLNEFIFYYKA